MLESCLLVLVVILGLSMIKRIIIIVFDGLGVGSYCGENFNSFENAVKNYRLAKIPTLVKWGFGNILEISDYKNPNFTAAVGRTKQQSKFCESFAAHWEFAGNIVNKGVEFSDGIPKQTIDKLEKECQIKFIGNLNLYDKISELKEELVKDHILTKNPILLTLLGEEPITTLAIISCDDIISYERMVNFGEKISNVLKVQDNVGRIVIKTYERFHYKLSSLRHRIDIPLFTPPSPSILDAIKNNNMTTIATGKISGLFNGVGFTHSCISWDNESIWNDTIKMFNLTDKGLIWANLNSLDRPYGHNKDVQNWIKSIERYDSWLQKIEQIIKPTDMLIFTGDHGCDPVLAGYHTREWNPLIIYNPTIRPNLIGDWNHIDLAATISDLFNLKFLCKGKSLKSVLSFQ